ncbi:helix-turn-helix transcriptional regulator [Nonomuraea sp. NPDC049419]|uniref:helix-turn-helix domain-containing protein n=1 Tax=Nonomuraea sp. NPDC049419 TaxID=3155772 RepID=UPI00341F6D6D
MDVWTGRRASALRIALRMTREGFARHLGFAPTNTPSTCNAVALKETRLAKGWSQTQLLKQLRAAAARLGKSNDLPYRDESLHVYISCFENGRRAIPYRMRPIYLEAFGASDLNLGFVQITEAVVASWEDDPDQIPHPDLQRVLDSALITAPEVVQVRFALLLVQSPATLAEPDSAHTIPSRNLHLVTSQ